MPITYPPAPVSLTGDVESINRFLNSPTLISRRLRTLAEQRFISDVLLTGRFQASGGSVLYEQNETLYSDRAVTAVDPGSEYPMTGASTGPGQVASTVKWGQDAVITDEAIKRLNIDPVNRAMTKLINQLVKNTDSVALSAIASAITQTMVASGSQTGGTAGTQTGGWYTPAGAQTILRDILKAKAAIAALNQGYDPDTLVVDDTTYAIVMSDPTITNALMREAGQNPIYSGEFPTIAGLRVLPTSNGPTQPTGGVAYMVDSKVLGGMADESLGGPGYTGAVQGVESKTMRDDEKDRWRLRARRVTVPVVIEPNAGYKITQIWGAP